MTDETKEQKTSELLQLVQKNRDLKQSIQTVLDYQAKSGNRILKIEKLIALDPQGNEYAFDLSSAVNGSLDISASILNNGTDLLTAIVAFKRSLINVNQNRIDELSLEIAAE